MSNDAYKNKVKIGNTDLVDLIDNTVIENYPNHTSDYNNDIYATYNTVLNETTASNKSSEITENTGVAAGTYGAPGNVTIGNSTTGSINIPYFTVDAFGRITSMANRTLTITTGCNHCSVSSGCNNCNNCSVTSGCDDCNNCNHCYNCNCQP